MNRLFLFALGVVVAALAMAAGAVMDTGSENSAWPESGEAAIPPKTTTSLTAALEEAAKLETEGEIQAAMAHYVAAATSRPNWPGLLLKIGALQAKLKLPEAVPTLRRIFELEPPPEVGQQAIQLLEQLLAPVLNPQHLEKWKKATELIEGAEKDQPNANPQEPRIHRVEYGRLYLETIGILNEIIDAQPGYHRAWLARASCFDNLDAPQAALKDFRNYFQVLSALNLPDLGQHHLARQQMLSCQQRATTQRDLQETAIGVWSLSIIDDDGPGAVSFKSVDDKTTIQSTPSPYTLRRSVCLLPGGRVLTRESEGAAWQVKPTWFWEVRSTTLILVCDFGPAASEFCDYGTFLAGSNRIEGFRSNKKPIRLEKRGGLNVMHIAANTRAGFGVLNGQAVFTSQPATYHNPGFVERDYQLAAGLDKLQLETTSSPRLAISKDIVAVAYFEDSSYLQLTTKGDLVVVNQKHEQLVDNNIVAFAPGSDLSAFVLTNDRQVFHVSFDSKDCKKTHVWDTITAICAAKDNGVHVLEASGDFWHVTPGRDVAWKRVALGKGVQCISPAGSGGVYVFGGTLTASHRSSGPYLIPPGEVQLPSLNFLAPIKKGPFNPK